MKIIALKAANVKRLVAVEIKPDGSLVIVGGANGAGKSSVLDTIAYALGGTRLCPAEPIRRGEKTAEINIELDDMTVVRKFSEKGSKLIITNSEGFEARAPQRILDSLVGNLSFDPLAFATMEAPKQLETLKNLVGLDFSGSDDARKHLYEERTIIGRDLKRCEGQLAGTPKVEAPDEAIDISALVKELEAGREHNRRGSEDTNQLQHIEGVIADFENKMKLLKDQRVQLQSKVASFNGIDTGAIEEKLAGAEDANKAIAQNKARTDLQGEADGLTDRIGAITAKIEAISAEKKAAIEAAKFPVEGLAFGDAGVVLNDLPFEQASQAEKIRVSVAMGLAMNPKLKVVLIREGSLLDANSIRLIGEMAEAADAQIWIEDARAGAEATVIIEDGSIKAKPAGPGNTVEGVPAGAGAKEK